jgi:predicted MFS family arabinose efflux permease
MSNSLQTGDDIGQTASDAGNTPSSWMAVFSIALTATVFCTTEFLPVGVLRFISEGLQVSEGSAGLMVSAPGLLAAIAAPAITVAVGRMDRRRVLLALSLLLIAANLLAMVATSFAMLIAGRVLFGVGLGGFWAIGAGLGSQLVEAKHAGRATSIIFAGVSLGMLAGGPAGALIGDLLGWRMAFAAALALSVVSFVAQVVTLPSLKVETRVRPCDLLGIAATRQGRLGLIAMFLVLSGQFASYTYITPFLAQISGFGGKAISSLLLGYTVIGLAGNFLGGAGRNIRVTLLLTIAVFLAAVVALPVLASSPWAVVAALAVWGMAYGAMPVVLQMWMVKAAPGMHEGGMALFVANFQISIAVGSLAGGLIVDRFGLSAALYLATAAAALALVTILAFGRAPASSRHNSFA